MAVNQEETTNSPEPVEKKVVVTTTPEPVEENVFVAGVDTVKMSLGNMFSSWQFKVGLGVSVLVGVIISVVLVTFFWQHNVAEWGMKSWAKRSGAKPIECMIKDTNGDKYVSCTALLNDQVVPLECSASVFNIGCRVNFGAAAAPPLGREIR
ncbi:MAG TPA: hypothetical protein V6D13_00185 [Halomicronema sp.]